jgi:hypothetical protein
MVKITSLLVLMFTCFGYGQTMDCAKFKDGTFQVTDAASKKVCIIKRDADKQTERFVESDETYEFDLHWVDDCTYTLTPTASTLSRNKDIGKIGTMTVKITQVKDNSYVHNVTVSKKPEYKRVDEVFVVKKLD